ncbi:MAG: YIP1 family protein [Candidatus Obscuribacterales bacterium]|nr:YIP1 family protein [Candidatus Obscuribacterales bacterium]
MNSHIETPSWWQLTTRILFSPRAFFAESTGKLGYCVSMVYLAKTALIASLINTLLLTTIFYAVVASFASILTAFTAILGTLLTPLIAVAANIPPDKVPGAIESFARNGEFHTIMISVKFGAILLVGYFGTIVISTCLQAGIAHLIARLLGSTGSFRATAAAYSFGSAAWMLSVIPLLNVIAPVYGAALNFYGMRNVHQLSSAQTTLTVGLAVAVPLVTFMLCSNWCKL